MIIIIDNQNSFIKKFVKEYLENSEIEYKVFDHNQPINIPDNINVKGVILSGGRGNPYTPLNLTANFVALMNYDVPTLGFCLSHEIIAISYLGQIDKLDDYYKKKVDITLLEEDPIFEGLNSKKIKLERRHSYHVSKIPIEFIRLAESNITPNEIIKHKTKPIYGFQSHPEASGKTGLLIMENFFKMCGVIY